MDTLVHETLDTRPRPVGWRVTPITIAVFLVVVLLAETGARVLATRIEDPRGWNVPGLAEHVEKMRALAADGEDVDVLLVGSSVVGQGLDPGLLAELSSTYGAAYSLHGPGFSARSLRVLVEDVGRQLFDPATVVIGVSSRELNDAGDTQDRQHEILQSSPALRRLAGRESPAERLERHIGELSTFFRLREVWRRPALLNRMLKMGPQSDPKIDTFGMELPEEPGFATKPAHLAQERLALSGFRVGGREIDALRQGITGLRREGIRVVVVNMPVYEDIYLPLHPEGQRSHDRYEDALEALTAETGVEYLDGTRIEWGREWFSNENHLNARGATRLTRLVAAMLDGAPAVHP